ncbi:MAG: hypothetical protein AAF916_00050 [Planctomycetota bacterium]
MSTSTDYLPGIQSEFLEWNQNLYDKLTAAPADYGTTADAVVPFATAFEAYKAAYLIAEDPNTRTKPSVQDKQTKKKALVEQIRPLVQTLQNSPVMTDAKRDQLQIPVRDRQPSPVPPPEEMPKLNVKRVEGNVIFLQLLNQNDDKKRPVGVKQVFVYSFIGANPSGDLQSWRFEGASTRLDPNFVLPETIAPNTQVWVTAQWVNGKGQTGPACAPVETWTNRSGLQQAA